MKKFFKWFLRITGILFLLIIIAAILIPILFKDKIIQAVKDEVNKNLNAKVDFGEFGFTIFRSFPDVSLSVEKISVAGINEFQGDTLCYIPNLFVKVDLFSLFGDKYKIKAIEMENPKFLLKVLKGGKANWDIAKPSTDTSRVPGDTVSSFKLGLKKLRITNMDLKYHDDDMKMYTDISGMNFSLSGDLTSESTELQTKTEIKKLFFSYEGIQYLKEASVDITADIDADLKNSKYTFKKNEFRLNELYLGLDGFVALPNETDIDMDLKFEAKKTEFKNFLSLIPAIYAKDFANIKTSGTLALNGNAKGTYNEKVLPSFELNIAVDNAMFQYPSLPQAVRDIAIKTRISNKGGSADNTVINISKFHFNMGGNPFDIVMNVSTPVSDPNIDAYFKGKIDLAKVKDFYPLEANQKLNGLLTTDLKMKGRMSSIEKQRYEEFDAKGNIAIENMVYTDKDFPDGVNINALKLAFSPQFVSLDNFDARIGKNDFRANGRIDNLLSYVFRNEKLKGTFTFNSAYLNLNDFMKPDQPTQSTQPAAQSEPLTVFEVPKNIDFTLNSSIDKLIYDNIEITGLKGSIVLRDERVSMENVKMNLMDGSLQLSGYYDSKNIYSPTVDFGMDISGWDFQKTFKTFNTVQKLAPVAEHCSGKFSTSLKFTTLLDKNMSPILNTMSGKGSLKTSQVVITNSKALTRVADALKMDVFRRMPIQNLNIYFAFKDGKVDVEPFDVKIDQVKAQISGTHHLDQAINYKMDLEVPTSIMGAQAKGVLNNLVAQANSKTGANMSIGNTAKIAVFITGTVTDPQIKTGLKEAMKDAVDDLKQQAVDEINKKKEELENKAREEAERLKAEAERMKAEAEAKAREEAERMKKEAEEKAKKEADRLKKEAEEKAKKELENKMKNIFK